MANESAEDLPPFSELVLNEDVSPYTHITLDVRRLLIPSLEHYVSYLLSRKLDDIQEAVRCAQQVFDTAPPHIRAAPSTRWHVGRTLLRRFQLTKQAEDVTQAIELLRSVTLETEDNDLRQICFAYLSMAFVGRDGNLDGFLELNPPHLYDISRPFFEVNTCGLGEDYEVLLYYNLRRELLPSKGPRDLDSEIEISRRALEFTYAYPTATGHILVDLGGLLMARFTGLGITRLCEERGKVEGKVNDVIEAIECFRGALELELMPEKLKACVLSACYAFHMLVLIQGRQSDLDDAFGFCIQAEDVVDSEDPKFALVLLFKSIIMAARYENTGDMNELDTAIELSSRAITNWSHELDGLLPVMLISHADQLTLRAARSDRVEDHREAIEAGQKAVDVTSPKDPSLLAWLTYLGIYELQQFARTGHEEYLERGLRHIQEAIDTGKENLESKQMISLGRLDLLWASFLGTYERSLGEKGLDRVITTLRDGMTPFLALGADCKLYLSRLLFQRWVRTGKEEDIDEAIRIDRQVIEFCERSHPILSVRAGLSLGKSLHHRYKRNGRSEDLQQALAVLLKAFRVPGGLASARSNAGRIAMEIYCKLNDWVSARKLSLEILDLFVIQNNRALNWQDKQLWLQQFSNCAADFASIALEAGCEVLYVIDTLEACRGAILGQLIDINDLAKVAPDKAQHFRALQREIDITIGLPGITNEGRVTQIRRRIQAEAEIRACLAEIRTLKGFHKFLLGPTQEELKAAAARGPIIIVNITRIRSDAIIITKDNSTFLRLPGLKYQKVVEYIDADLTNFYVGDKKNNKYRQLQEWLWDNCVKLILEKLDNLTGAPPKHRVCWIGIGIASSLPFHAAGVYAGSNKRGICKDTALSRIISTYTSTLKVLIHGQRKLRNDSSKQNLQSLTTTLHALNSEARLAVVSMPSTPGMLDLDGVQREAEEVLKTTGDTFSTRHLLQPTAKDTMAHMAECEIVHFACHGESALPDLSKSHLLLQTTTPDSAVPIIDKLTLKDVAVSNAISCGKLAFLSACSTAQNRSSKLRDEALHLVSGFQVAGYLHAIGNLWPSDDDVSVEVVKGFYQYLVAAGEFGNGDNVAEALNKALSDIAAKYPRRPLCWAQFVHFGILM